MLLLNKKDIETIDLYCICRFFDYHFEAAVATHLTKEQAKERIKRHPNGCYVRYEIKPMSFLN